MQETTTILYDFWQFVFFATIFTAIVAYFSYKKGWGDGYSTLFSKMLDEGVIEFVESDEPDEDIY